MSPNITNRNAWYKLVRELASEGYSNFSSIRKDETGWRWIAVGHNASHSFYVGHDEGYNTFAVKSIGEGFFPEGTPEEEIRNGIPPLEIHIHRHSSSLTETLRGAYLGHF